MYADDTQLYFPLGSEQSVQALLHCLNEVKGWLSKNFLQLSKKKSEIILFGLPKAKENFSNALAPLKMPVKDSVRNLGIITDI